MTRIQIITIIINIIFLIYISKLVIKGKLREEYSIVWIVATLILLIFSLWSEGLAVMAKIFGVYEPANLVFTTIIFIMLIYLLHLSVVNSKLQQNVKKLTQELSLMKEKIDSQTNKLDCEK